MNTQTCGNFHISRADPNGTRDGVPAALARVALRAADRHGFWLVVAGSLALQGWVWLAYRHSPFYEGLICDAKQFLEWGRALLVAGGASRDVFYRAPLYPYLLWALWSVTGPSVTAALLLQALLNAATTALVFLMARRLGGQAAGWLAALLAALCGPLTFYAFKLLSETPAVFLQVLCAWLLMSARSRGRLAAAGAAGGLLALAKPQTLLTAPVLLLWVLLRADAGRFQARLADGLAFGLPILLLVSLTAAHNYSRESRLVLVAANGGANVYIGNHDKADGIFAYVPEMAPGIESQEASVREAAERAAGRPLTNAEVSAFWFRKALAFIRANPRRFLRLECIKIRRMLSAVEYSSMYYLTFERATLTPRLRWLFLDFALLWPLAGAGAAALLACGRRRGLAVPAIMIGGTALNVLVFFADERFRLPMAPFFIAIAAAGLTHGWCAVRDRSRPPARRAELAALILLAGAAGGAATRLDPGRPSVDHTLHLFLGDLYFERGEFQRALDAFVLSSQMTPNNWESALGVSKTLYAMGRHGQALSLYRLARPPLGAILATAYDRDKDFAGLRWLDARIPRVEAAPTAENP